MIFGEDYAVRHPGEVLLAAVADADAVLQRVKQRIELSGEMHEVLMLGEWIDRASKLAKVVLDANVEERLVRTKEQDNLKQADDFLEVLSAAVTALGHDVNDPAVRQVIFDALSGKRPAPTSRPRAILAASDAVDLT